MADTQTSAALRVQQWQKKFRKEYVRENRFKRYMGQDEDSVIQLVKDLEKDPGDRITVNLVARISSDGVEGDDELEGNEQQLGNYGHRLTVNQIREAVVVPKMQRVKSAIDLLDAAKVQLKTWIKANLRDRIIRAMMSPVMDGKTAYADATETQKDAWLAANDDRVLFGAALANNSSNDHSASLLNIDGTSDDLHQDIVSLAKRLAQDADRHIAPVTIDEDEEWFVLFVGTLPFRDLKINMSTVHKDSGVRGKDNPLYRDGDLTWDGVVIRCVPEIPVITGVGAGGINVGAGFFCGAQAVAVAWAQMAEFEFDARDYKAKRGVSVGEVRGVEKLFFGTDPDSTTEAKVQHGMVTIYVSAVADA
jgi:N4-gp56 family major capsid protein